MRAAHDLASVLAAMVDGAGEALEFIGIVAPVCDLILRMTILIA
jgi:ABC-type glycerol-3-phosphate transport system permease component